MPNWCINTLTIKGKPKDINKLMKQVELTESESGEHNAQVFSCHKVIPRPVSENDNWYNWNTTNWGSKWDCTAIQRTEGTWESGMVSYTFDTAWSPIVDVITKLGQQHKKLTITYTYFESGSDYWGEMEYTKGVQTSYEGGALSEASCERKEYLMGEHHWCNECYDSYDCDGEGTPEVCPTCEVKLSKEETELWEGEENESATQQQIEVA